MPLEPILEHPLTAPVVTTLSIATSLAATVHLLLTKRETKSSIGWLGLIWLSPFLGAVLYVLFGINRITRKARSLRQDRPRSAWPRLESSALDHLHHELQPDLTHMASLGGLVTRLTGRSLHAGNSIEPLSNGDEAYPAMLAAIDRASRTIALCSYIFNDDAAGRKFLDALKRAHDRGVTVRVLVDDVGSRYDLPTIKGPLRNAGIPMAAFMPTLKPGWFPYFNLRTHRKMMIVDGRDGFTGGMNIDKDYDHSLKTRHPKTDMHFHVRGPVVSALMHTFIDDWAFTTDELLGGEDWLPWIEPAGPVFARAVASGPDVNPDKIAVAIEGALATARKSVAIMTPYFVPEDTLISALIVTALRGVQVDIILPEENNLALVKWASMSLLSELLEAGCRVWSSPPPFDHTKLMIVDGVWSFVGSANWDARSFRLNFELNLECYDRELAGRLGNLVRDRMESSKPITLDQLNARSYPILLRDNIARLFSPYL